MALIKKEIALSGKLVTAKDPSQIGVSDFSLLENMRYGGASPKAVGGMTAINATALADTGIDALHYFRRENPTESHLLAHAGTHVYRNGAIPPATGNFDAAMFTDSAGAGAARFGDAPGGMVTYCNGKDTAIWGGAETPVGAVLDMAQDGSYKYDLTDALLNSLATAGNTATLHRYADTLDANTLLMLHCDGANGSTTITDSSPATPHTAGILCVGNAALSTARKVFGTASLAFDGTGDWVTIPDNADFDLSSGIFTLDFRVLRIAKTGVIFYQQTDATNYIKLEATWAHPSFDIDRYGYKLTVVAAGVAVVTLDAPAGAYYDGATWDHVAVVEDGDQWKLFINGTIAGSTTDTGRAADYSGLVYIGGDGTNSFNCYIDEFRLSNVARWTASFTPPSSAYGSNDYKTDLLVGSTLPICGAKFYVETPNASAATVDALYWNGSAYAQVASLVDGTSAGGKTLAQDGSITFTDTVAASKLRTIDDVLLHWYKFQFSGIDATVVLSRITLLRSMQQIQDTWSGDKEKCVGFAKNVLAAATLSDFTSSVQSETWDSLNTASYADLTGMAADDCLYVGANVPACGVTIKVAGANGNTQPNSVARVDYWDGSAWTLLHVEDETIQGTSSFGKSGTISWAPIAKGVEQKTTVVAKGPTRILGGMDYEQAYGVGGFTSMYPGSSYDYPSGTLTIPPYGTASNTSAFYYRITFSAGTHATSKTYVYNVGLIPAPQDCRGYAFGITHINRNFLFCNDDGEPNTGIYSASDAATVFNGSDSGRIYYGDGNKVVAAASLFSRYGSDPQNLMVVCKPSQTILQVGDTPETFRVFPISDRIGCIAPYSMAVATMEVQQGFYRRVAVWLSQEGVVICDGNAPLNISDDIGDKFDPLHANYIGAAVLPTCSGFLDPIHNEYHLIVPGSVEWVYKFANKAWFKITRGTGNELERGVAVYNADGVSYAYGAVDDGKVYRLENGTTFDGAAIPWALETADIALQEGSVTTPTSVMGVKFIAKAKTDDDPITLTHYGDSATSGNAFATISPVNAGKRLIDPQKGRLMQRISGPEYFHRFRMSSVGAGEPLFFAVYYEPSTNL